MDLHKHAVRIPVQLYRLRMTQENYDKAIAGSFVFEDNDSDTVIGFISVKDVDRYEIEICTFHPVPLPPGGRVVKETLSKDEWTALLRATTDADPLVKNRWADLVTGKLA